MIRWTRSQTLIWLLLAACPGDPEGDTGSPTASPVRGRPLVQLARCVEVAADGSCVLGPDPATLRVWIDQQERSVIRVHADGVELTGQRQGVDGGLAMDLDVPEGAQSLTVEGIDPRWSSDWEVTLRRQAIPSAVTDTNEAFQRRDLSSAIAQLSGALTELRGHDRLVALDRLRELHFGRGDLHRATDLAGQVVDLAQRLSQPRTAARAASSAVFMHAYQLRELAKARPFVAVLDELATTLPEAAAWSAFCHGLMARAVGDTTRALDSFREAERLADRLGMHNVRLTARQGLGVTYGELARGREAVELAQRVLVDAQHPAISCSLRYTALNTAGWVQLLLQQRQVDHTDPVEFFERALALVWEGGPCPNPNEEINVRINLALTALGQRDPAMALAWLEPVEIVPPSYRSWVEEVHARAGLALGRWELVPSVLEQPDPRLPGPSAGTR